MAKRRIQNEAWNFTYSPAAVGTAETVALFTVQPGMRVIAASARKKVLAGGTTNTTIEVGDGTDTDGFIAAIDTEAGAVNDLIDGAGALFANTGGKLYLVADTIDAKYVNGGTPGTSNPVIEFRFIIRREW